MKDIPKFPYHRDPFASDCLEETDIKCQCCDTHRGMTFKGVTYSREKFSSLCPWCIADGSASKKFGVVFFDAYFCDDEGDEVSIDKKYYEEVFGRTIGFSTFNPIGWWVHCGLPAEYVKRDEPYDMIFECRSCRKQHVIHDLD